MRVLWLCNIMLPVYAKAKNMNYSVREGWLSGCLDRFQKADDNNITLAICFPKESPEVQDKEEIDGITFYGFEEDLLHPEKYDEGLEERFSEILSDFNPDVVHVFGTEFPHNLAMLKAFNNPSRSLLGIQGLCGEIAEGYMADIPEHVQRSSTFRDRVKHDSLLQQVEKFRCRAEYEKEAILLTGNITGRTFFDREATRKINPEATYYSMNETMRPCFYEGKWEEKKAEPHSIFLSQGDYPLKGFHFVLKAMPKVLEKYPDAHLYVAGNNIIGKGKSKYPYFLRASAYGKYIKSLISEGKLKKNVTMVGMLSDEEMKERYLNSSLFICPSVVENSPNSVGEAMLLGVPVLASQAGGIPSLIQSGREGLLFEKGNVEQLADSIIQMWDEPVISAVYGDNAAKRARVTHDADKNYKRLLEIYDEISKK